MLGPCWRLLADRHAPAAGGRGIQAEWGKQPSAQPMKEISPMELLLRLAGRVAAVSGVIALIVWVTWVMLDVKNLQSGFTLP